MVQLKPTLKQRWLAGFLDGLQARGVQPCCEAMMRAGGGGIFRLLGHVAHDGKIAAQRGVGPLSQVRAMP